MDHLSKKKRSWNMGRVRSKNTKPELLIRSGLHRLGFRFNLNGKVSKRYSTSGYLPGKPDIIFIKYKTVIFINGCFWHQHAGCQKASRPKTNLEFWNNKLDKNIARDEKNYQILKDLGWNVIIIWECQIQKNKIKIIEQICKALNESII